MIRPSKEEEQFKARTYSNHREHFDHFLRLHALAEESLVNFRGFVTDEYYDSLVLIFPRAYKSFDSIRRLCEVALCEDAAVVLRSLLNLVVVTRWISIKPQTRAKKYLAWYWVEMNREAEQSNFLVPAGHLAEIRTNFAAIRSQFEYTDKKGKIRMPDQWYQPEANNIFELFKEVGLEKQYEAGYKPLSGIEHSDAMAYLAMMAHSEKIGNETKLGIQSDLFIPGYLRNAFQWFGDIFRTCNKTVAFTEGRRLDEVLNAGIKFYEADMLARGIPTS